MMCVASLIEKWFSGNILLLEKNLKLWEKVSITGGGRCNITTWLKKNKDILSKYIRWSEFLKYAMKTFPPSQVYKWFENHGVPLKIEDDMRVFPQSNKSKDVIDVFTKIFEQNSNLTIKFWTKVSSIEKNADLFSIQTNKWNFLTKKLIIATWWQAYQNTWSDGDWYQFAKKLWHSVSKLSPSLSSLVIQEEFLQWISWFVLQNAKISFSQSWTLKHISWALLFTHFGISWPLAFVLSAHLAHDEISTQNPIAISIQMDLGKSFDYWNSFFLNQIKTSPNKLIRTLLGKELPEKFIKFIQEQYKLDLDCKWSEWSKEKRKKVCHFLSGKLLLHIVWRKAGDEFVTAGGVELDQVNPKTMESLICENLFFGGELLDIDAVTWGFNLQSAWCTGRVIALSILG